MVIWSEPAKTDLRSIHDFIARNSKHYAKKVTQDIREKTDILDELSKIGKMVREYWEIILSAFLPYPKPVAINAIRTLYMLGQDLNIPLEFSSDIL